MSNKEIHTYSNTSNWEVQFIDLCDKAVPFVSRLVAVLQPCSHLIALSSRSGQGRFLPLEITPPFSTNESITFDCKSFSLPIVSLFVCSNLACDTTRTFDEYLL